MPYLTDEQIDELSNDALRGTYVLIKRPPSQLRYKLYEVKGKGMKGLVWQAKDDLGGDVALKIIPVGEYEGRSVMDEMTEAEKLSDECFAGISLLESFN